MHSSKYRGDKGGLTKDLFDAANQGKIERLKSGLQRGPGLINVMRMSYKGSRTLLGEASMYGRVSSVDFLLSKDADDRVRGTDGYTPLLLACRSGHTSVVELLLRKGPHRHITHSLLDLEGNNALHVAVKAGKVDTMHALLRKKLFDLAATNTEGDNVLHLAIKRQCPTLVQALLDAGADVSVADGVGRSPFDLACTLPSRTVSKTVQAAQMSLHYGYHLARARALLDSSAAFASHGPAATQALLASPALLAHCSSAVRRKRRVATADEGSAKRARAHPALAVPAPVRSLFNHVDLSLQGRVLSQAVLTSVRLVTRTVETGAGGAARSKEEEERHAMMGQVMTELPQELFREMMLGLEAVPVVTRPRRAGRRRVAQ